MNMVCDVVDRVLKSPLGALVHELNPDFKAQKMPFKRMKYTETIWVFWVYFEKVCRQKMSFSSGGYVELFNKQIWSLTYLFAEYSV